MLFKRNFKNSKNKFLHRVFQRKTRDLFIILTVFIFSFQFIYSYNDTDTHPDLTVEIVKLYNLQNPENKLSNDEMELIRQGSILEDTPPRWINHFYNPETGKGWTADNLKGVSQDNLKTVSEWFLSHEPPVSSLNWAHNQELQNKYSLYKGNHTFEKAVYDYAAGKKEEGLKSLGYILHLIEDASVPDHTRDDTHADISGAVKNADEGSPYEDWSENYTKNNSLNIAEDLNSRNKKYYKCENFDSCLINLASYSHYNFFSEDTIFEYENPKIFEEKLFSSDSGLVVKHYFDERGNILVKLLNKIKNNKIESSVYTLNDPVIMSSYWSHLSSEAVLTGAGVIDLFFKEVEKAEKDYGYLDSLKFKEKEPTMAQIAFMPTVYLFLGDVMSPAGEYFRGARIYSGVKSSFKKTGFFISSSLSGIKNKIIESFSFENQQAGPPVLNNNTRNISENSGSGNNGNENSSVFPDIQNNANQENVAADNQNNNMDNNLIDNNGQNFQDVRNNRNLKPKKKSDVQKFDVQPPTLLTEVSNIKPPQTGKKPDAPLKALSISYTAGFGGGDPIIKIETNLNSQIINNQNQNLNTSAESQASSTLDNLNQNNQNQNSASSTQQNSESQNQNASSTSSLQGEAEAQNSGSDNTNNSATTTNATSTQNQNSENNNSSSTPTPPLNENSNENNNSTSTPVLDNTPPNAPVITFPKNLSQIFTNSKITFNGAAEASATLKAEFVLNGSTTTATTSVSSAGAWSLTLNLSEGATAVVFFAADSAGNVSSSTSVQIFIDSKAPEINEFKILECFSSISADGCLIATTTVNLNWSADTDAEYFELSYAENIVSTTSTSTVLILSDNASHSISLRAKDKSGNFSESQTLEIEINTKPVIINEVAWAGTGRQTSNDEWIELYNRTNKPVSLNNFILYAADFAPYIKLQNQIPAKGYYLLERTTKDDAVLDIKADQFFTGAINNSNENLYLVYKTNSGTTTIDYIYSCTMSGNWCGGTDNSYQTMERYNPDENTWGTHLEQIHNGTNANGGTINGTPKARNSLNYLLATTTRLQADTTLKKENSPYFISRTFTVPQGKKLTIEPGVAIKIHGGSIEYLNIEGELYAIGTESEPIVFTSFYDDEYGGDLNGDGGQTFPSPGNWYKINFTNTSSSTISYAKFRYGGANYWPCCSGMVKIEATSTITNSVFEYSYSWGLELVNSNAHIANNIFRNNNNSIQKFQTPSGIMVHGPAKILNNLFSNNYFGIYASGSGAEVIDNIFNNNVSKAISVTGNDGIGTFKDNSGVLIGGNTDGIYISDFKSQTNSTTTLFSNSIPYIFNNNPLIRASSALVIMPGVLIKNKDDNRIEVFGSLIAEGENAGDIVFTSLSDPSESYWFGISANPGSLIRISGVSIKNGGKISSWGAKEKEAALYIDSADTEIKNSLFENNYKNGIIAVNANPAIKNTEFKNHLKPNFDSRAVSYYNSKINLENASFRNNFLGIYADAASVLGAVSNIIFEGNTGTSTINLFP